MKRRTRPAMLGALLGAAMLSPSAVAADTKVAGTWKIDGDVQGYPIHETCTLSGPDDKLTGKCVGEKTVDATAVLSGSTLTLKHPGEYQGEALTLTFTGKLQDDASVSGSIDVQPLNYDGTFTGKKDTSAK